MTKVTDNCLDDSTRPAIIPAQKDFAPSGVTRPLALAEFVTIAREVVQDAGRSRRAIRRFNTYVDVDNVLCARRGKPEPTSAAELIELLKYPMGSASYYRCIHEVWLDFESACRALREYRSQGGVRVI